MTSFFELFDVQMQPKDVVEKGITQDTMVSYISTTFLNGYVNYLNIYKVIMIERYEKLEQIQLETVKADLMVDYHTNYSKAPDDIILFGETNSSYWFLWSDKDVSDSSIARVSKTKVGKRENFFNLFIEYLNKDTTYISGNFIELHQPTGWITL